MRRLPAFVVLGLVLGLTGVAPVFASALSVIHVDLDNDTVSGTAEPGVEVTVTANGAVLYELADGAGNWEADFAGVYDIPPGSSGEASVVYPGGTEVVAWSVPLPGPQPIEIAVPNYVPVNGILDVVVLTGAAPEIRTVHNCFPAGDYMVFKTNIVDLSQKVAGRTDGVIATADVRGNLGSFRFTGTCDEPDGTSYRKYIQVP